MIFVLDTNVLWKPRRVARLADVARPRGHTVAVPALAHAERVAQLRREKGDDFDATDIDLFIQTHHIVILPFDQPTAERAAEALATRYPKPDHWHAARRARCATRFQILQPDVGEPCPATVDWYLMASYGSAEYTVVTHDRRDEFEGMPVLGLDEAIRRAAEG
jgi:hypothetical protein